MNYYNNLSNIYNNNTNNVIDNSVYSNNLQNNNFIRNNPHIIAERPNLGNFIQKLNNPQDNKINLPPQIESIPSSQTTNELISKNSNSTNNEGIASFDISNRLQDLKKKLNQYK